jgi:hypothetical protein
VVVELVVAVEVAVVVEVDVGVPGGVPFGHPRPPKMSTIILITLSDKVIVLKKNMIDHFMLLHSQNNHHPASTLSNAPPSAYPLPLPPHVDCRVAPLLTPAYQRQHCETPSPRQCATTDAPTSPANALTPTPHNRQRVIVLMSIMTIVLPYKPGHKHGRGISTPS